MVEVPFREVSAMFGVKRVVVSSSTLLPMELRRLRNTLSKEFEEAWSQSEERVEAGRAGAVFVMSLARALRSV